MNQLLLAIILTILPVSELRAGLPVALDYALKNNLPILPVFVLITAINIAMIFLVFLFLDFLHGKFLKIKIYEKFYNFYIKGIRKKIARFEKGYRTHGFLALIIFVAIPLPATGAWTGCLIAWLLNLERKKSILAISLGVLIAGIVILAASLGMINLARLA